MKNRTLVISDIHGCYDEFNLLLKKVEYNPLEDELILLGDYCDRGFQTKEVIEHVILLHEEWGVTALLGNHDQMMLDSFNLNDDSYDAHWIRNGGMQTIISYCGHDYFPSGFEWDTYNKAKKLIKTYYKHHLEFLSNLKLYHETEKYIYVHAGINPIYEDWRKQPQDDFIWIRNKFFDYPTGIDKVVVFGHTPTINLHSNEDIWFGPLGDKICVDGGCAYGFQLNCLEISGEGYTSHFVKRGAIDE